MRLSILALVVLVLCRRCLLTLRFDHRLGHLLKSGEPLLVLLGEILHVEARTVPNDDDCVQRHLEVGIRLIVEASNSDEVQDHGWDAMTDRESKHCASKALLLELAYPALVHLILRERLVVILVNEADEQIVL